MSYAPIIYRTEAQLVSKNGHFSVAIAPEQIDAAIRESKQDQCSVQPHLLSSL
jgi:hypothetical protein